MKKYIYEKDKLPRPIISGHDDWVELYYKAWEMAFNNIEYVDKEGWKPQLTCMPGVGKIWQWDSCFMTFITNYSNGTLSAFNNLDNIYRLQRKSDGFICMAYRYTDDEEAFPGRINPPLFAWAEWNYYLISGDTSRFERVVPIIEGLYSFIENNRRRTRGLYWFEDPGSTGMDNSPRGAFPSVTLDGNEICHIDLAAQQALSAECLAKMYSVMGNDEKSEFYTDEHSRICDLINRYHWNEKTGFYYDFFHGRLLEQRVKYINSKTLAAVWAMTSGAADSDKIKKLNKHFFNEGEFYTKIPFATLSKDDPNYDATGAYWLGGVWAPTNYALMKSLKQNGYDALARDAAVKYITGMYDVYKNYGSSTIWEAYAPESFAPALRDVGEVVKKNFVGWSGLGPITMLIENIIGLSFDAQKNTVRFTISDYEKSGIENLHFNGGYISVVCQNCDAKGKKIYVKAEKPFDLHIKTDCSDDIIIHAEAGGNNYFI